MPAIGAPEISYDAAGPARLLVVTGADEGTQPTATGGYRVAGASDVFKLIPEGVKYDKLNLRWQALRQNLRPDLSRYDCVLNLVTDADRQPRTIAAMQKLLRFYRGRVINRPEAVPRSTRELVAKRLAGIPGLRVPKIQRPRNPRPGAASAAAQRAGLTFPLIVRMAGNSHRTDRRAGRRCRGIGCGLRRARRFHPH